MLDYLLFRPVCIHDLDDIYELSLLAKYGLSTLPKDKDMLEKIISTSQNSFKSKEVKHSIFFFVLEDLRINKVVGTASILNDDFSCKDFFVYKPSNDSQNMQLDLINLSESYSTLGTLYLHPSYRSKGVGRFLSIARLSFVVNHPHLFNKTFITELRGMSDENGKSFFWDHIMRPYFNTSFFDAAYKSNSYSDYISSHIPTFSIDVHSLPDDVKHVLGRVHPNTIPAMNILRSEGFEFANYIDIFDGGPKMTVLLNQLKAFRRVVFSSDYTLTGMLENKNLYIFSTGKHSFFRACCSQGIQRKQSLEICIKDIPSLTSILEQGKILSYMRLYPKSRRSQQSTTQISDRLQRFSHNYFLKSFSEWYTKVANEHSNIFYR